MPSVAASSAITASASALTGPAASVLASAPRTLLAIRTLTGEPFQLTDAYVAYSVIFFMKLHESSIQSFFMHAAHEEGFGR